MSVLFLTSQLCWSKDACRLSILFVSQIYFLFFPKKYFLFFVERQGTEQHSQGTEKQMRRTWYDGRHPHSLKWALSWIAKKRYFPSFLFFTQFISLSCTSRTLTMGCTTVSFFSSFFPSSFIYSSFSHILSHSLCVRLCDWEVDEYYFFLSREMIKYSKSFVSFKNPHF